MTPDTAQTAKTGPRTREQPDPAYEKAATFGDKLVEQVTAVDADRLPLQPRGELPTVDHTADIVQITERTGRSA